MAPSRQPRAAVLAAATFAAAAFAGVTLSAGAAWAGAKPARARAPVSRTGRASPPFSELVKAARKNDRGALERLASRMGVARLAEGARAADASIAQASLAAIPLARGGVLLASTVAERLEAPDAAVAAAAAQALGTLLDGDSASELGDWEVPPDVVARACGGLRGLITRADAPLPSRLAAIDAAANAQVTCGGGSELVALMRDPIPAVRRAAALALRPTDAAATAALRAGFADPDGSVVSASVASVCRRLDLAPPRHRRRLRSRPRPSRPPRPPRPRPPPPVAAAWRAARAGSARSPCSRACSASCASRCSRSRWARRRTATRSWRPSASPTCCAICSPRARSRRPSSPRTSRR
jgi:hypothetical protein